MTDLRPSVLRYLERAAPIALSFWTAEDATAMPAPLAACDVLYALVLIGRTDLLVRDGGDRFASLLSGLRLAGGIGRGSGPDLNVHLSAYALGTLNLLDAVGRPAHDDVLQESGWQLGELVDPKTLKPQWPSYFSHHSWRVGHWIGGVPSIIKSLWSLSPDASRRNGLPSVDSVLEKSDELLDDDTGLLRAYRSDLSQKVFRFAYRFRHDPEIGDIGGVAHLHWVNYAAGRPYKNAPELFARSWRLLRREPFVEGRPYCLDFDAVQLCRTSLPHSGQIRRDFEVRAHQYAEDICKFLDEDMDDSYPLHKLPGALATLHECALATGKTNVRGLQVEPIDIPKQAHWL
jgi:hypothetical protein